MIRYILKRILIFIPTLFAISLLTFIISINTPGDPVETMLNSSSKAAGQSAAKASNEKTYIALRKDLGLDLPLFYFTVTNSTSCDTLYRIPKKNHREVLDRLSYEYGKWELVSDYYHTTRAFENELFNVKKTKENAKALRKVKEYAYALLETSEANKITGLFEKLAKQIQETPSLSAVQNGFDAAKTTYQNMVDDAETGNRYIPKINWYGASNQYHVWLFGDKPWFGEIDSTVYYRSEGFFRGDFGKSYQDKRPVASVVWEALGLTFSLSLIAILLTYMVSIPIGVFSAVNKGSRKERSLSTALFMLYSMPTFWIGTMLVTFLCNPDYFDWFPPAYSLLEIPEDAGFFDRFVETAYYLILPLFCWTYGSLTYLSRQMRGGMLTTLGQDYIRTAHAKGLSKRTVVWKHAFRNSLIPVITLFASVFPLAISGSIVIEIIFSIPGMGKISYEAIVARNYPVIYTVMMFTGILTLLGTLVADVLYAVVDPRISFKNKK